MRPALHHMQSSVQGCSRELQRPFGPIPCFCLRRCDVSCSRARIVQAALTALHVGLYALQNLIFAGAPAKILCPGTRWHPRPRQNLGFPWRQRAMSELTREAMPKLFQTCLRAPRASYEEDLRPSDISAWPAASPRYCFCGTQGKHLCRSRAITCPALLCPQNLAENSDTSYLAHRALLVRPCMKWDDNICDEALARC